VATRHWQRDRYPALRPKAPRSRLGDPLWFLSARERLLLRADLESLRTIYEAEPEVLIDDKELAAVAERASMTSLRYLESKGG